MDKHSITIDKSGVAMTFDKYLQSPLAAFLMKYYERIDVGRVFQQYAVGYLPDGSNVFWYIRPDWKDFTNSQHLVKGRSIANYSNVERLSAALVDNLLLNDYPCPFGAHLIDMEPFRTLPIALVLGELDAVIGAIRFPQFLWLGISRANIPTFNPYNAEILKGRTVTLFPNRRMVAFWQSVKRVLEKRFVKVQMANVLMDDNSEDLTLFDAIVEELNNPQPEEVPQQSEEPQKLGLSDMIKLNPEIQCLIDTFGCIEV